MNKRFFTFQNKKRPHIILKWAQTQDGFIAPKEKKEQKPVWITNEFSRQLVHKMRAEEQAILAGTKTVLDDNPSLTTRDWEGNSPIRIILDRALQIPETAIVFNSSIKTIVLTEISRENNDSLIFETIDFSENIAKQVCEVLYKHNIQSVIVEGGAKTLQTFIDENLWDEAFIFKGSTSFYEGLKAPLMKGKLLSEIQIKNDLLFHYINTSS